ncbi:dihydropteroate synthase [Marinimicrobium sp. ABcell2]|uniref:dihydropteroate synthase n=1 Tax=Marinimicrobium sp. ABcell2 TaxID=3069751 RepID=UPI0027B60B21|nr:dihydropteroate synthase [Marinimicrobium sp. ABcell2]MDQ2075775.1 dihydropteroate synthase [Marinimicrobium sp. ABcell2]
MPLQLGDPALDLSRPRVMGVLNTTPDSFSDGGQYYRSGSLSLDLVLTRARKMLSEGADIIDVGGESTRPGATPVSEAEELDRVVPVVEVLARELGALISVDTSTPAVMREAASVGAGMLNDVRALQRDGALKAAAETGLPVCLMHMQGQPATMQINPEYQDPVAEVRRFLQERMTACEQAGIARERLLLDPGFGFGKTLDHNLELLRRLGELTDLGCPLLVGLSRKSMLAKLLDREVSERLPGSLALAMAAAERGANIIRVHDVAATVDVLKVLAAVTSPGLATSE